MINLDMVNIVFSNGYLQVGALNIRVTSTLPVIAANSAKCVLRHFGILIL